MTIPAQAVRYGPDFLASIAGRPARGLAVTVLDTAGLNALVYNGPERRLTTNPFNTGNSGEVDIWLDPGAYRLSWTDPVDGATTKNIAVPGGSLTAGRYPLASPYQALLGQMANVADPTYPARTNLEWPLGNVTDGALAATGVGCFVAIPIDPGVVVSKISIIVGAAAEGTGTHAFAALYSGIAVPALIGQSTDLVGASAVGPVNARFDFTLTAAQRISAAQAPFGFIYAEIAITATTVPTVASVAIPTAVGYQWTPNGPLFLAATAGAGLLGTAAATIVTPAAKAVGPIVILT